MLIGTAEAAFRWAGGAPDALPSRTPIDFQWKLGHAKVKSGVFVVGDSRVSAGFSEGQFDDALRAVGRGTYSGINAGMSASPIADVLHYVRLLRKAREPAGILVVNYSPMGFYHFKSTLVPPVVQQVSTQDWIDDRIDMWIKSRVFCWHRPGEAVYAAIRNRLAGKPNPEVYWSDRTEYRDGLVSAHLKRNDGSPLRPDEYELDYYGTVCGELNANDPEVAERRSTILAEIAAARNDGWRVVLVRAPIGQRMLATEAVVPASLFALRVAADAHIPFWDYQHDVRLGMMTTLDESHLTPESARRFSRVLAEDVNARLLQSRTSPGHADANRAELGRDE